METQVTKFVAVYPGKAVEAEKLTRLIRSYSTLAQILETRMRIVMVEVQKKILAHAFDKTVKR